MNIEVPVLIKKSLCLDFMADFSCPWCFLGFRRLLQARKLIAGIGLDIHVTPFLLNPGLPPGGHAYGPYIGRKLGGKDHAEAMHNELQKLGEAEGLAFDFAAIETVPDTLDAHRVAYWAGQAEKGVEERAVNEIFSRYFEQGQDIGRRDVLVDAADAAGMRADIVAKLLASPVNEETIRDKAALARQIGISGVPCFILERKFVVMGAESAEALADAIRQTADGFAPALAQDR